MRLMRYTIILTVAVLVDKKSFVTTTLHALTNLEIDPYTDHILYRNRFTILLRIKTLTGLEQFKKGELFLHFNIQ